MIWTEHEGATKFDELLEATLTTGPQFVSKDGIEVAVMLPIEQWRRSPPKRSAVEVLLADEPRFELELPKRGQR